MEPQDWAIVFIVAFVVSLLAMLMIADSLSRRTADHRWAKRLAVSFGLGGCIAAGLLCVVGQSRKDIAMACGVVPILVVFWFMASGAFLSSVIDWLGSRKSRFNEVV